MKRYTIPAELEELEKVKVCANEMLLQTSSSEEEKMAVEIAIEEIFVNIVKYAEVPKDTRIELCYEYKKDERLIILQFRDEGVYFNPLEKKEPEVHKELFARELGGLGIYMVKKMMDDICYEHRGGKNILTLRKKLSDRREDY